MVQAVSLKPQESTYLGALEWLNRTVRFDDANYDSYFAALMNIRKASGSSADNFSSLFQEGLKRHVELKQRAMGTPQEAQVRKELAAIWKDFEKDFSRKGGIENFDRELARYAALETSVPQQADSGFMTGGKGKLILDPIDFKKINTADAWRFVSSEDFRDEAGKPLELYFTSNKTRAEIETYLASRHRVGLLIAPGEEPAQEAARGGTLSYSSKAVVRKTKEEEWQPPSELDLAGGVTAVTGRAAEETKRNAPRTAEDALRRAEQIIDPITGKIISAKDIASEAAWHFEALDGGKKLEIYFDKDTPFEDIENYMRKMGRYGNLCKDGGCSIIEALEVVLERERKSVERKAEQKLEDKIGDTLKDATGIGGLGGLFGKLKLPKQGKEKEPEQQVGRVVSVTTMEEFEREVLNAKGVVIVDIGADWCGPCQKMKPHLEEAAVANGWKVVSVELLEKPNVEQREASNNRKRREIINAYDIGAYPTVMLFVNGKEVEGARSEGAMGSVGSIESWYSSYAP